MHVEYTRIYYLAGYNVQQQAQPVHAPPYSQYPQQQVTAAGLFDQGARFDPNKPVSIPVRPLPSPALFSLSLIANVAHRHLVHTVTLQ